MLDAITQFGRKIEIVKELLDRGADVNSNYQGYTPLVSAITATNIKVVKELLDRGADPNSGGYRGETPLMVAVRRDRLDMLRELLDRGADIDAVSALPDTFPVAV